MTKQATIHASALNSNNPSQIAIICSQFNSAITTRLQHECCKRLHINGIQAAQYKIISVPGAVEIPFAAQCAADSGHYRAVIALGAVIRGETSHYDVVCQQVAYGCQRVMLDYKLPVIFGVITANNMQQAQARCDGVKCNFGANAADAVLKMLALQC